MSCYMSYCASLLGSQIHHVWTVAKESYWEDLEAFAEGQGKRDGACQAKQTMFFLVFFLFVGCYLGNPKSGYSLWSCAESYGLV